MERLKTLRNAQGYSMLEMTLVMGLLVLFSLGTLTLVASGSSAYKALLSNKTSNSELRVALAYVSNKVKQADSADGIVLKPQPYGEGQALVISEVIEGEKFETWIYYHEGALREGLFRSDTPIQDDFTFEIATLSGFEVSQQRDNQLTIRAWRDDKSGRRLVQTMVTLYAGAR